ncbi:hypothetical protein ACJX0J_022141 [Zea mays]
MPLMAKARVHLFSDAYLYSTNIQEANGFCNLYDSTWGQELSKKIVEGMLVIDRCFKRKGLKHFTTAPYSPQQNVMHAQEQENTDSHSSWSSIIFLEEQQYQTMKTKKATIRKNKGIIIYKYFKNYNKFTNNTKVHYINKCLIQILKKIKYLYFYVITLSDSKIISSLLVLAANIILPLIDGFEVSKNLNFQITRKTLKTFLSNFPYFPNHFFR